MYNILTDCHCNNEKLLHGICRFIQVSEPCFENGVLLMYTLEGVSSVANFITAYEESQ